MERRNENQKQEPAVGKSWEIYLTTSSEAAALIAHGFTCDLGKEVNGVVSVCNGAADGKDIIPAIYYGKGYFYAAAEVLNHDGKNETRHKIIVC